MSLMSSDHTKLFIRFLGKSQESPIRQIRVRNPVKSKIYLNKLNKSKPVYTSKEDT